MEIAVITPDTLCATGLGQLLHNVQPEITVRTFANFGALADDTPDMYQYYFVSSQIYVLYTFFFLPRKEKTIILMHGTGGAILPPGNRILNVFWTEPRIQTELKRIFAGNLASNPSAGDSPTEEEDRDLTAREIEVLILVSKGYLNKEIADKLGIGLTTVITHRKNVTEKLGIKSASGLTMYAVMNGYTEIS